MKKRYILSAMVGGTFFAIPYLALGIQAVPSAIMGVIAYGAGTLIFKDKNKEEVFENESLYDILKKAKEMTNSLYKLSNRLERADLSNNIKEICSISNKIIDTISKNPKKLGQAKKFLNYYLPVTIKIISRYDEIEDQKLNSNESKKFMESIENMVEKIKEAFNKQLNGMYQAEILDTDAEIKVFESMLESDGFMEDMEIRKKSGGENLEK